MPDYRLAHILDVFTVMKPMFGNFETVIHICCNSGVPSYSIIEYFYDFSKNHDLSIIQAWVPIFLWGLFS